ncbi:hypothetical protein SAMN06265349_101692 [Flavobacterium resistens]|uniref:DUF2752 domain-containing protein n=1 Tax=Flavobacterium resistens TaxID=443612 RepID=A0A521B546_9FLAO|nr:hypothetical protein SAMN06265349_101692 [Flavobacterium resistens]
MILSKKTLFRKNKEYHFFNLLIFVAILFLIFYLKANIISIKCPYSEIGIKCKTCGLTTSFRKIINNDFSDLNIGFLLLFIAFASQLILRPLTSFALFFSENWKLIRNIDIMLSLFLFGFAYAKLMLS